MELTPEEIAEELANNLKFDINPNSLFDRKTFIDHVSKLIREYGKKREVTGYKDGFEDCQNGYKYKPNRIE